MRLREIMSKDVRSIEPFATAEDAYAVMKLHRIHHLVVQDKGRVVGVLSERDLGGRSGTSLRAGRSVSELMTQNVTSGTELMTVREAANLMRGKSIGCLPVLKGKKLMGIITVTDMLELIGTGPAPNVRSTDSVKMVRRMSDASGKRQRALA